MVCKYTVFHVHIFWVCNSYTYIVTCIYHTFILFFGFKSSIITDDVMDLYDAVFERNEMKFKVSDILS